MKKKMISSIALLVALLSMLSVPVYAGPPSNAEGLWRYQPSVLSVKQAGCNTIVTTFENGEWTGTFEGTSTENGKVVIHCNGNRSFNAIVTFDNVTVDGRSGSLTMSVVGMKPNGSSEWEGKSVLLSGTGELANLRGEGIWWGPGAPGPGQWGDIYYSGNIHFEPE